VNKSKKYFLPNSCEVGACEFAGAFGKHKLSAGLSSKFELQDLRPHRVTRLLSFSTCRHNGQLISLCLAARFFENVQQII
jgi:hypothetical protein